MNKPIEFPMGINTLSKDWLSQFHQFDNDQLTWLSGYCSGIVALRSSNSSTLSIKGSIDVVTEEKTILESKLKIGLLYGSQTGNSETLAKDLLKRLSSLNSDLDDVGIDVDLNSLADFNPKNLKNFDYILLVVATHGEGEPPDDAMEFYDFIKSKRAPKLQNTRHAVLALGDSSYEFFCQTGKDFDKAFTQLGSKTIIERLDCDLDYEEAAEKWIQQLVEQLTIEVGKNKENSNDLTNKASTAISENVFNKNNPFLASVLSNQKITGRGSVKTVHHIELSLEESGISYLPGDSLGVWVKNNSDLIDEILTTIDLTGAETVLVKNESKLLRSALEKNLEITLLSKNTIKAVAKLASEQNLEESIQSELENIINNEYSNYIANHQFVDLLMLTKVKLDAQNLVDLLPKIKPRLYSISSSLSANPDEVHITVGLIESDNENGTRKGAASQFLLQTLNEDDEVLVYVDDNSRFKLPNDDKPIILIGPGTGVAPFRSFLQERKEQSDTAPAWLFFGNPNFNTDFLYQTEWQQLLKSNTLTKLDVAFSRDQKDKIYVQDKLLQKAKEIWKWIEQDDAYFYVCGDMKYMAKDVEQALLNIICEQGNKTLDDANDYLKKLKKDNRYQRDVY